MLVADSPHLWILKIVFNFKFICSPMNFYLAENWFIRYPSRPLIYLAAFWCLLWYICCFTSMFHYSYLRVPPQVCWFGNCSLLFLISISLNAIFVMLLSPYFFYNTMVCHHLCRIYKLLCLVGWVWNSVLNSFSFTSVLQLKDWLVGSVIASFVTDPVLSIFETCWTSNGYLSLFFWWTGKQQNLPKDPLIRRFVQWCLNENRILFTKNAQLGFHFGLLLMMIFPIC